MRKTARTVAALLALCVAPSAALADYWVSDFGIITVRRYNDAGVLLANIPTGSAPAGIAAAPNGFVYVALRNNTVRRFDPATNAFDGYIASGGGMAFPDQIAIGPTGDVFVASFDSDRVLRYDGNTGAFVSEFATVPNPRALTFGPAGDLFVSDDDRILRFNGNTGASLGVYTVLPPGFTEGLTGLADRVFVTQYTQNRVDVLDSAGLLLGTFPVNVPRGGTIGADGDYFVVFNNGSDIQRFDGVTLAPEGTFISGMGRALWLAYAPVPEPAALLVPALLAAVMALRFRRRRGGG